jgi:hypothetical protein
VRRESIPDNRNNDSSNLLGVGPGVTDEQATFQVTSRVGKLNTGGDWVKWDRPQKFPRREVIHWLFLSRSVNLDILASTAAASARSLNVALCQFSRYVACSGLVAISNGRTTLLLARSSGVRDGICCVRAET